MKTVEIKKKLINEINSSTNTDLLEELYIYLNQENTIQKPFKLSEEQNLAIEEARRQIKAGEYLTNEQANQEIEEWLNK